MPNSRRFADPARFALGVAVPTDASRWQLRQDGTARDLATVHGPAPAPILERLVEATRLAKRAGVSVYTDLQGDQVPELFEGRDVVTLIAHGHSKGGLELENGVLDAGQFVTAVPVGFTGCLDLIVCHSEQLATKVRFERGCVVIGHERSVKLGRGLTVYLRGLLAVLEQRRPYHEVIPELLLGWTEDDGR